jgi:hypothetical protein
MLRRLMFALPLLVVTACAPSLIAGTTIEDTEDNKAVLDVLRRYKNAFEAKDAKAIIELASPRYLDSRDSISRATLEADLEKEFGRVKDVRLDINVRRIEVTRDRAVADYFFSTAYIVDAPSAEWKRESDDRRMILERDGKEWKVLSGF